MKNLLNSLILIIGFSLPSVVSTATTGLLPSSGIIIIGDSGKNNQGQLSVSEGIQRYCKNFFCNLGILAGDVVYPNGVKSSTDPILETVFDKYYNPLNFPFLIALGNHDYGKYTNAWKQAQFQIDHGKKNPLFHFPDHSYTYETEDTIFAVIDTTRLMWKKSYEKMVRIVREAHKLANEQGKWFMVMGHHPYLSNGKHGNAGNYERIPWIYFTSGKHVKTFLDENVCGKAHFYISGHEHLLQVFDGNIKGCNTQLIVSGTAASASKIYKRNSSIFESKELGFFHMLISPDVVTIKAVNQKEEVLFQQSYSKNRIW